MVTCILADGGCGFDVEFGIELERIREVDVAAGEREIVSAERHFPAEQVDVAEQNRVIGRAAQMQVAIDFHLRADPLDARARGGVAGDIERKIAHEGGAGADRRRIRAGAKNEADIDARREQQALQFYVAAEDCGVGRAAELQTSTDKPTHSRGITHAHLLVVAVIS